MTEQELIDQLRARAGVDYPVATPNDIVAVEEWIGFELPPLLKRLYLEVSNGGFGPSVVGLPPNGYACPDLKAGAVEFEWPDAIVCAVNWGCGAYSYIDIADADAPVLTTHYGQEPDWETGDTWDSLHDYLEDWLNGVEVGPL